MRDEIMDDSPTETGRRALQPMLPPDHPTFEEAMNLDVFNVVASRQMHNEQHNPTCFKYGLDDKL
jgi:hypothetical protein